MIKRNRNASLYSGSFAAKLLFVIFCSALLAMSDRILGADTQDSDDEPLSFAFTQTIEGIRVQLDGFRLHADCRGSGPVTVLFEPGLGGSAFEWHPMLEALSSDAHVCVYDRAGYGWSDPSPYPRHARQLAQEADQMLHALDVNGPLILVAHSFGGFVARMLADRRSDDMVGMVLLDTSHEDQLDRLEQLDGKSRMPRDNSFVVSQVDIPDTLPRSIRRKIAAFSRMRKTYVALHAEMRYFRTSADQVRSAREPAVANTASDFPIVVVRRGLDLYSQSRLGASKTAIWQSLQEDLLTLGKARMVVAQESGHHIHADQPQLVTDIIRQLLEENNLQRGADQK